MLSPTSRTQALIVRRKSSVMETPQLTRTGHIKIRRNMGWRHFSKAKHYLGRKEKWLAIKLISNQALPHPEDGQINTKIDLQPQILRAAWLPVQSDQLSFPFVLGASKRKTLRVLSLTVCYFPGYMCPELCDIGVAVWHGGRRQALESYRIQSGSQLCCEWLRDLVEFTQLPEVSFLTCDTVTSPL